MIIGITDRITALGPIEQDNVALARYGIPLANNPSYGAEALADTAVTIILAMTRRIAPFYLRKTSHSTRTPSALSMPMKIVDVHHHNLKFKAA